MIDVSVKLPDVMLAALKRCAAENDSSVGQIVREAITRDLHRRERAKTSGRTDERLVAPLRALLADDFNYARGWAELENRLNRKGFTLREAGGGVILCRFPSGQRLCKGSELGHSLLALRRRFRSAFPSPVPRIARAKPDPRLRDGPPTPAPESTSSALPPLHPTR
jgi:hypothetical protein